MLAEKQAGSAETGSGMVPLSSRCTNLYTRLKVITLNAGNTQAYMLLVSMWNQQTIKSMNILLPSVLLINDINLLLAIDAVGRLLVMQYRLCILVTLYIRIYFLLPYNFAIM